MQITIKELIISGIIVEDRKATHERILLGYVYFAFK